MRSFGIPLVRILLLSVASSAWADQVLEKPVAADSPDKFAQTAEHIHREMQAGGRYEFIKPDEKEMVDADLNAMASMLRKSGSVAAMTQPEKASLFGTQEHLNGVLTHSDVNRLICQRTTADDPAAPRTSCNTVGDIERHRKGVGKTLDDVTLNSTVCGVEKYCAGH